MHYVIIKRSSGLQLNAGSGSNGMQQASIVADSYWTGNNDDFGPLEKAHRFDNERAARKQRNKWVFDNSTLDVIEA